MKKTGLDHAAVLKGLVGQSGSRKLQQTAILRFELHLVNEDSEVEGGLAKVSVVNGTELILSDLQECLERSARTPGKAQADKFGVRLQIDKRGRPKTVVLKRSTTAKLPGMDCVLQRLAKLDLPNPMGGSARATLVFRVGWFVGPAVTGREPVPTLVNDP